MPIEFNCENCQQLIRVPDESAGHQARCPFCQNIQSVPSQDDVAPTPPDNNDDPFGSMPPPRASQFSPPPPPPNVAAAVDGPDDISVTSAAGTTPTPVNPYRDPPANPYGSVSQYSAGPDLAFLNHLNLASLGDRFLGVVIDYLFCFISIIPGFVLLTMAENGGGAVLEQIGSALFILGILAAQVTQYVLISSRAQSVGKIVMKTRIVTQSGAAPGFVHGVVLRIWILGLLTLPFCLCWILAPVVLPLDGIFIFGERRQCLHDMLASTFVVSDRFVEGSQES